MKKLFGDAFESSKHGFIKFFYGSESNMPLEASIDIYIETQEKKELIASFSKYFDANAVNEQDKEDYNDFLNSIDESSGPWTPSLAGFLGAPYEFCPYRIECEYKKITIDENCSYKLIIEASKTDDTEY